MHFHKIISLEYILACSATYCLGGGLLALWPFFTTLLFGFPFLGAGDVALRPGDAALDAAVWVGGAAFLVGEVACRVGDEACLSGELGLRAGEVAA